MNSLVQLIVQTFLNPRAVAAGLTAERYDRTVLWSAAFLVIILAGIAQYMLFAVVPMPTQTSTADLVGVMAQIFATPFLTTLVLGTWIIMSIFMIYFAGRMLGGTGHFPETLVIVIWLQFVQVPFAFISVTLLTISPQLSGLASMVDLISTVGVFYATLHFIDVLHGYNSLWAAFGTLVIGFVGVLFGIALIVAMIGGTAIQSGAL